ncbi:CPBP family intramembrane glutamic endopeptidase [Brumimicrobium aurantiacum]|uniref:CPBP family intramembrane metalloprotease n=1 Tax=Brumimicrobium aurantiacum TaxID=1737063 RepID=A0A3E1EX58_9FLAO|nr:CPBP family intramembrane glutamic endopeptidase [Brumimicrobium aurantiacum]RFC54144.1 CPBP family intramembrane metalloprotease [Brumimicrobium aurantiacum]
MKEKFKLLNPFSQALMLVIIGVVSFILLSIILNLAYQTAFPELPMNKVNELIESYPIHYMILNFLPLQVGFFLIPGIIYWSLSRLNKSITLKTNSTVYVWSILLFLCAFFLLPFFSEINIEIVQFNFESLLKQKEQSDLQLKKLVGEVGSTSFYVAILTIGLLTGIAEELAFRRFLFHHMFTNTQSLKKALFSSAFIFALLHFNYLQILPLFTFGLVLGMMYYVTGSLIPGIIMHAANNMINVYWLASDNFPEWMEEINLYTTIPATAVLLLLVILYKRKKGNI